MPNRPFIHVLVYSPAGSGKSHFARTFPKPMLVLAFDPRGKMAPYTELGVQSPEFTGEEGQGIEIVLSKKTGRELIQIEYFHDETFKKDGGMEPTAYPRFLSRMPLLYDEVREGKWKTVVIDTTSAMRLASKNLHQYKLRPNAAEPRQWDAGCTNDLEQALTCRLTSLRCNLVILAHVDNKDTDEVGSQVVRMPALPGRLSKADGTASKYPEMYTIRVTRDPRDKSVLIRTLQTQPDAKFNCMSVQIKAPDGVEPDYRNLWTNYDAAHGVDTP